MSVGKGEQIGREKRANIYMKTEHRGMEKKADKKENRADRLGERKDILLGKWEQIDR